MGQRADHGDGRQPAHGAKAEAEHRLERNRAVAAGAMPIDAKPFLDLGLKRGRPARLAGLGPAELNAVPARRMAAKIMIKADSAVNFGARQVQRIGHHRHNVLVDIAEPVEQRMKDWQSRAVAVCQACHNGRSFTFIPSIIDRHFPSQSFL
jgi:hypothetical protein